MTTALIGYTGFVGGSLAREIAFDLLVNRSNLESLRGRQLESVVCAGLPAAKWLANRDPAADRANVLALAEVLDSVEAERFVLVSTIDVYPRLTDADEAFDCEGAVNHAYGANRLEFEARVRRRFPAALIVRLPALFGPGLRKNVLFDLLHDNQLAMVNPDSRFQWYPLRRLAGDLRLAQRAGLRLVNLFTQPLGTRRILERWFPGLEVGGLAGPPAAYDLRTRHAGVFGGDGDYVLSESQVLEEIGQFVAGCRADRVARRDGATA